MARTRLGKMERKNKRRSGLLLLRKKKKKEKMCNKNSAAKELWEKKRNSMGNTENVEKIAIRKWT